MTRLPTIEGAIPHPFNRPTGCTYHPRCGERIPGRCQVSSPKTTQIAADVTVRCFLHTAP